MNPFEKYSLTRVINACGKMTALSGAIVLPEIREAAAESMKHSFVLIERVIFFKGDSVAS